MGWVVNTMPRPLNPRERPGTNRTGDWIVPRAKLDGWAKSCPTGIDPWTVQRVAIRYTDCAIPALLIIYYSFKTSMTYRAYICAW